MQSISFISKKRLTKASWTCLTLISCFLSSTKTQDIPLDCRKLCLGGSLVDSGSLQCSCLEPMGDLMLTSKQSKWIKNANVEINGSRGGATKQTPWKGEKTENGFFRIPFTFSPYLYKYKKQVQAINKALSVLNALTCIRFEPAKIEDKDKIDFIYGKDCSSQVGKQGGTQKISVGKRCGRPGIVLHEVMHALGFWHEHSRHDRDKYVKVLFKNIKQNARFNFFMKTAAEISTFSSPYDYKSVMHYNFNAFSKNDNATIIQANTSEPVKAQRLMLSKEDQYQLRAMYECGEVRGIPETVDCMHHLDRGVSYRGKTSRTASGKRCQRWDSNKPHAHSEFPSHVTGVGLEENYCRNPDIDIKPWCYTTDKDVKWEHCDIPYCSPSVPEVEIPEPLESIRGFWTVFSSWSDCEVTCGQGTQLRVRHCIGSTAGSATCPGTFWERKNCSAAFSCPIIKLGNWGDWLSWSACNNTCGSGASFRVRRCSSGFCGKEVRQESSCSNKDCPLYADGDCYDSAIPDSYRGRRRYAENGKKCMRWSRSSIQLFRRRDANLISNFCRNPDKDRNGPYCYTSQREKKKYCIVPSCNSIATWSKYSKWSACSSTCGGGAKYRVRICQGGYVGQGSCEGDVIQSNICNFQECEESARVDNDNIDSVPVTEPPSYIQPISAGKGCAELGKASAYRGTASTTFQGLACQHWDSMHPHKHHYRTIQQFEDAGLVENYCRAPEEGDEWPWCYVLSLDVVKQACDIPMCIGKSETPEPDANSLCFNKTEKQSYRGTTSTTLSGLQCQRWDENQPHEHLTYKPYRVLGKGLGPHNYCRNPDDDAMPWCITTNPKKFWEFCDVTLC